MKISIRNHFFVKKSKSQILNAKSFQIFSFVIGSILILFSCEKEPKFRIGQDYQGGIIFYVDETGNHGLIAASEDVGQAAWGCPSILIKGADAEGIGSGFENTLAIVRDCNDVGTAAELCENLVLNGFDDWFLPSKEELNQLYLQRKIVGGFSEELNSAYWSSTEYEKSFAAWRQLFTDFPEQTIYDKYNIYNVRPIRRF